MLENLAELFRAVWGTCANWFPGTRAGSIRRYVEIEQTRWRAIAGDWQVAASHPRTRVPQLLLQPIIENAVRYGAERVAGVCQIDVKVRQRGSCWRSGQQPARAANRCSAKAIRSD